jgi:sugar O-acyltransferase (sialic acid O-acetyltransferase NeuD family)
MEDVVIIGAGGHGKVVLDVLLAGGKYRAAGFVDNNPSLLDSYVCGLPVLGPINALPRLRRQRIRHAIIAIGDNRQRLAQRPFVDAEDFTLVTAVHPAAYVSPRATLGRGVVIAPGARVVVDANVRDLAVVNTSAVVEHECDVGEGAHVCPGAILAGRVRVGRGAFIGVGAQVIQCRTVGDFATVGAGAAVIDDVPDDATVVGVPARPVNALTRETALAGVY